MIIDPVRKVKKARLEFEKDTEGNVFGEPSRAVFPTR